MTVWLPLGISWATSLALATWALRLHRDLLRAEEERDQLWDESHPA